MVVNEDADNQLVDLYSAFADDPDPDASLTYEVTADTNASLFSSASIAGRYLTLDFAPDAYGVANLAVPN